MALKLRLARFLSVLATLLILPVVGPAQTYLQFYGSGDYNVYETPGAVGGYPYVDFYKYFLVVKSDGRVYDSNGRILTYDVRQVASRGSFATLFRTRDNHVVDQFGGEDSNIPAALQGHLVDVAVGPESHAAVVGEDGHVFEWGSWYESRTDYGASQLANVVKIDIGPQHALAVRADGSVVGWGNPDRNVLKVPKSVVGAVGVVCGDGASYAWDASGVVTAWGTRAVTPPDNGDYTKLVVTGSNGVIGLKRDGTLRVWGTWPDGAPDVSFFTSIKDINPDSGFSWCAFRHAPIEVSFDNTYIFGGGAEPVNATVKLDHKYQHDVSVWLNDESGDLRLPSRVVIPKGELQTTFAVGTRLIPEDAKVFFTARTADATERVAVDLHAIYVRGYVQDPEDTVKYVPILQPDQTYSLQTYIATDATTDLRVTFGQSDANPFDLPASVTIPAGTSSLPVALRVNPQTPAGTYDLTFNMSNGQSYTTSIIVADNAVTALDHDGSRFGGQVRKVHVKVTYPAPDNGLRVNLTASNGGIAVPAYVTIPAGKRTATFDITAADVDIETETTLTAQVGASQVDDNVRTVPNGVASVTLASGTLAVGQTTKVTVALKARASTAVILKLGASDKSLVDMPAELTIPAGKSSATFVLTAVKPTAADPVRIRAFRFGHSRGADLVIGP